MITLTLAFIMIIGFIPQINAQNEKRFRILLNGIDIPLVESMGLPYIEDSRTLVPLRLIGESLGYSVDWNEAQRLVSVSGKLGDKNYNIKLTIGQNIAVVNGENKQIDESPSVVAKIRNDRTFVPLRFISENMGAIVDYSQSKTEHLIKISTGGKDTKNSPADFALNGNGGKGATIDKKLTAKHGFLLRAGETETSVLERLNQGWNGTPTKDPKTAGNVSKDWVHPEFAVVYFDPIENKYNIQAPWGFCITNASAFIDKPDDWAYLVELIDDRYVPYKEHLEIKGPNGKPQTMLYPINTPKWTQLNQMHKQTTTTDTFDYDPYFGRFKDTILTKGMDRLYAPHMGEDIKYRVTIRQGSERHQYEYTVPYLWMVGAKHREILQKNNPEFLRDLLASGMTATPEGGKVFAVNNWKQIY